MPSLLPPHWNNALHLPGPPQGMTVDQYRDMLANTLPDLNNLDPLPFAIGLGSDDEQFPMVELIIRTHYDTQRLGDERTLEDPEGEALLVKTTKLAVVELMYVFENTNVGWVSQWARALLIYMWRTEQQILGREVGPLPALPHREDQQEESPILPQSVGSGSEHDPASPKSRRLTSPITRNKLSLVPEPLRTPQRTTPVPSVHNSIIQPSLEQMTFSLDGFTHDRHLLFPNEELIATRCVRDGDDPSQLKNYYLDIFLNEFEDALNLGRAGGPAEIINLRNGKLGYRDPTSRFKRIQKQSEFEVAINHLFNARTTDTLKFQFYQESGPEKRNRELEQKAVQRLKKIVPPDITARRGEFGLSRNSPGARPARGPGRSLNEEFTTQPQRSSPPVIPLLSDTASKRSSIIGGIRRPVRPQGNSLVIPVEFAPQPPTPHRLSPPIGVTSSIKRALRVQKNKKPASLIAKVDRFEVYAKKFASLYQATRIDMYKRGGSDDFKKAVLASEVRSSHDEDEGSESEDEEEPSADEFMVTKLQRLLTEMDMSQLLDYDNPAALLSKWNECCKVFKIDPTKTELTDTVPVYGLHAALYQYQAFAVYWQMKTSRTHGGGFVADDPGLGKTLTYLAYIVAERQLGWLWNDVNESRKANDGRHLQQEQQHKNDKCPSHDRLANWIACPCSKSSPTHRWNPKPGVRLAVVPENLVKAWKEAFVRFVATDSPLDMRCVVANPTDCPAPGVQQQGYVNWDSRHRATVANLKAERNPLDRRLKHSEDTPQPASDRWFVITTSKYYYTWVKDFEYKALLKSYAKDGSETWVTGKNPGIIFGIAMIDECHEEWQKGKGRSGVLADLPKLNQPFLWGYSGTPFSDNPRTLEGVLWAIESHWPFGEHSNKITGSYRTGWVKHERMSNFCYVVFDTLCKDFASHCKSGRRDGEFIRSAERIIERYKEFLKPFMLRRTAEASWFGRPLVQLKPHLHSDIWLQHNNAFDNHIERLREVIDVELVDKLQEFEAKWESKDEDYKARHNKPTRLTFNTSCRVQWRLRIISTFPYLVILAARDHRDHLNLTTEEFVGFRGKEKSSPYSSHLTQIVESSPKCMWLHGFITDLIRGRDIDGNEQKLVIITNFNPVALIIKLFIERYVKDKDGRVGALYAGMKQRERNEVIEAFTDAQDEKGNRKQKQNYQFLVGTTRFLSTGLQLTRACNVVLMEPDFEYFHELQGYARVHRIGQRNLKTFSYRLLHTDDAIERAITYRQANRNEFPGRFYEATVVDVPRKRLTQEERRLVDDANSALRTAGYADLDIDSYGEQKTLSSKTLARAAVNIQEEESDQDDTRSTVTAWPDLTGRSPPRQPFTPPTIDTPEANLTGPLAPLPLFPSREMTPVETPRPQPIPPRQAQAPTPHQPSRIPQPEATPTRRRPKSARMTDPAPNWPVRNSSLHAPTTPAEMAPTQTAPAQMAPATTGLAQKVPAQTVPAKTVTAMTGLAPTIEAQRYSDLLTPHQSALHDVLLNPIPSGSETQPQESHQEPHQEPPQESPQDHPQSPNPSTNESVIVDEYEDTHEALPSFITPLDPRYQRFLSFHDHLALRDANNLPIRVENRPLHNRQGSVQGSLHSGRSVPNSPSSPGGPSGPSLLAPQTSVGRLRRVDAIIGTDAAFVEGSNDRASDTRSAKSVPEGGLPEGGERVDRTRTDRSTRGPSFI